MNAIGSSRLRAFEAEIHPGGHLCDDHCRPVRMQGVGWGEATTARSQAAWRRTFVSGSVWRRSILTGGVTALVAGIGGMGGWLLLGCAVTLASIIAQCGYAAQERRTARRVSLN